ncbi:hypothetical protein GGI17_003332 [Coemansia sp. S146]|nr:hypothetical protein GGI17_003332 [Coemansia sp. S146]
MPGPRQAPTSPLEESPLLEQYQTWYSGDGSGGGTGCAQQQQQMPKEGFIGTAGRRASLLTPHSPTSDVIALTERLPRRSVQQSPSFISAANSISGEAENIAVFSNSSGNSQRAPSAPVARYNSQHANTSDMHVPSDKGRHPHHYKPPPAHSYVRSAPARASGGPRQQPLSQLTARQPPHTKMQYQYYQQPPPPPPLPPQSGLSGYHHQATHSQPPPPFTQLYSMTRLGHVGSITNKLGHGMGSGGSGLSGSGRPLTAEEKEMKRKVSHSAIEKRRRERTNAVLRELQTIVPGLSKPGKIQKLEILEAAADYIRQLTTTTAPDPMTLSAARTKQRRSSRNYHRMFYQQDIQSLGDYNAASRRDQPLDNAAERPALLSPKTIDEQHMAIATPVSVSSTASNNDDADVDDDDEDSADDDGAALVERVDACRGSELPPSDPASMKVTFLLC